jgi:hypothetical protein
MPLHSDVAGVPKFFGYNYFGPGNPYPNGESLGPADDVARDHDKFYSDILSVSDQLSNQDYRAKVGEADSIAIEQFVAKFRNGDLASGFGAAALSIKSAVEKAVGRVIYPVPSVPGKYASYCRRHLKCSCSTCA